MSGNTERNNKGQFIESRQKTRQRIAEKVMIVLLEQDKMSYETIAMHSYWMADSMIYEGNKE